MLYTLAELDSELRKILSTQVPPLQIRKDTKDVFEAAGTKPTMQGKQMVQGYYFGSVMPKPSDIRLYFFPVYTHANAFTLSDDLKKQLKGKSCFHLKKVDEGLLAEIREMIEKGVALYRKDGLI